MNIFILDQEPSIAAIYQCDKHIVKMVVELYQQLGSAVIRHGATPDMMPLTSKGTPLKGGHPNHPCTRWCGETRSNFKWAYHHAISLRSEYIIRYKKFHSCHNGIDQLGRMEDFIPDGPLTPFAQAMPDQYKDADAVKAYRAYYIGEKKAFAKWKTGNAPYWWK
jgi:hypothetical protein